MAGLIPQTFIDDLVARTDIVEVIHARVPLKKAGRDHKACCPFHDEKTPSFTVSQGKQFYHCFGCGAHGTVLRFLMDYERMDFVEAVEELASLHSLEVPREGSGHAPDPQARSALTAALAALEQASAWYKQQLRSHSKAAEAAAYLKSRGMSGRTAARFQLGYAPPGWDNLAKALSAAGVSESCMSDAGLLSESDRGGRRYDRFRNRVMFPIHDRRGRVVGFGARTMGDDTPKYLNSPESVTFHKGRELYGLFQVLRLRRPPPSLLVVEGYMDVVILREHGIDYACATLGTAATPEQMERLFRSNDSVVFCFDGDEAGRQAAWRALTNTLPLMHDGRQARFMFLHEGEDPDSFVTAQGRDAFEAAMAEAPTLTDFLFQELRSHTELRSVEGRARLIDEARPLLQRLPPGALRSMTVARLGALCQMQPERLEALFAGGSSGRPGMGAPAASMGIARRGREVVSPIRRAITLLLHHPRMASACESTTDIASLDVAGATLLHELIEAARRQPAITTGGLLERFREHARSAALQRLASREIPEWSEPLQEEFLDCLERLRAAPMEARYHELRERAREGELSSAEKSEFSALVSARARSRHGPGAKA